MNLRIILWLVIFALPAMGVVILWSMSGRYISVQRERHMLITPDGRGMEIVGKSAESRAFVPSTQQRTGRLHVHRLIITSLQNNFSLYFYDYDYDVSTFDGTAEYHYDFPAGPPSDSHWHFQKYPPLYLRTISPRWFGIGYLHASAADSVKERAYRAVIVRYELLLLLGVSPLAIFVTRWLRRYLARPYKCSKCGYDLRATPDRCPECGKCTPNLQSAKV